MECPLKGWLSGAAAMLLLPVVLASQTPPRKDEPLHREVDKLVLKGVKAVDPNELKLSIATDASHCVSRILTPFCLITHSHYIYARRYLDHDELKRDVLRTRVFYWKRGYRETEVDTLVTPKGEDDATVTFLITEGPPTIVSGVNVTQTTPVLTDREIA
ncbi:MAG TPA: POTRA domain-containing protein, partial [Gemmatimonadaceae bacterium]|nr:POTRA domain-containing protein [Gemmatimonadaceae bacterium]